MTKFEFFYLLRRLRPPRDTEKDRRQRTSSVPLILREVGKKGLCPVLASLPVRNWTPE